jgi:hypothetical protein
VERYVSKYSKRPLKLSRVFIHFDNDLVGGINPMDRSAHATGDHRLSRR